MKDMVTTNKHDIIGNRYGRLVVLSRNGGGKNSSWLCLCDCGNQSIVNRPNLRKGHVTSCGCYNKEVSKIRNTTHGLCRSTEYHSWALLISRCTNKKNPNYASYGGRGISVCERWLYSFENFIADMGAKPSPEHSIDRHPDINGNYEPLNCRWATKSEQAIGRRSTTWIEYDGKRMISKDWAKYIGVTRPTFCRMLQKHGANGVIEYYLKKKKAA